MKTVYERADVISLLTEVFRELGYEGTTFSAIAERTGLGKGSLYHFFPGGKVEMAAAVLAEIDMWFEAEIYAPLRKEEPFAAIDAMWRNVDTYFRSGRRACLIGAFALDETRERFADRIRDYFAGWISALAGALLRAGYSEQTARDIAEDWVSGIQGAIVLARALNDNSIFARSIERLRSRVANE